MKEGGGKPFVVQMALSKHTEYGLIVARKVLQLYAK